MKGNIDKYQRWQNLAIKQGQWSAAILEMGIPWSLAEFLTDLMAMSVNQVESVEDWSM